MKKLIITLVLVLATVMNVSAMSKYRASREARFLTDKMAWELDLSYSQMEDVYEINYDYFRALVSVHANNSFAYEIRNEELSFVLTPRQWTRFITIEYFYTPVQVRAYSWYFPIYTHYTKSHFYYDAPHAYSHYTGGHAHNKDFYRGRVEIHTHAHEYGYKPHSSGNIGPAHGMTRDEYHRHNQDNDKGHAGPQDKNHGNVQPHGNINNGGHGNNNNGHGNVQPHNNGGNKTQPQGNSGNKNHQQGGNKNQNHDNVPNRNVTNRTNNTRTSNTGSTNTGTTTRPTRSQATQNSGSHTNTSGRR